MIETGEKKEKSNERETEPSRQGLWNKISWFNLYVGGDPEAGVFKTRNWRAGIFLRKARVRKRPQVSAALLPSF